MGRMVVFAFTGRVGITQARNQKESKQGEQNILTHLEKSNAGTEQTEEE